MGGFDLGVSGIEGVLGFWGRGIYGGMFLRLGFL